MELALLAINGKVFRDPGGVATHPSLAVTRNFADRFVRNTRKYKSIHEFYPWEGDLERDGDVWVHQAKAWEEEAERLAIVAGMAKDEKSANLIWRQYADAWEKAAENWDASNYPKARESAKKARKQMEAALKKAGHWEVLGSPGKKVTIKYENWFGDFKAEIRDYVNCWVDRLFVSSSRDGKIDWGTKADPGLYKIEAGDGVEKEFKILPKKSLVLEAKFVRDSFGSLYLSIEYKNWPRNKRMGIKIMAPSGSELYSKETERADGKIEWDKNHDFKPGEYTIRAFVDQQYGDPFLKELLQKGQLVEPKKIKAPSWGVSSRGKYIVVAYENWPDRFKGEIVDVSGKKMETFDKPGGEGKIEWGGSSKIETGLYFVKVKVGSNKYEIKKAVVLK